MYGCINTRLINIRTNFSRNIRHTVSRHQQATNMSVRKLRIKRILTSHFVRRTTAPFPTARITSRLIRRRIKRLRPLIPVFRLMRIFQTTRTPMRIRQMLRTLNPTIFRRTISLARTNANHGRRRQPLQRLDRINVTR